MRFRLAFAALAAATLLAVPAAAVTPVTLFSQNFNTVGVLNNQTNIPGFTVTSGQVDVANSNPTGFVCVGGTGRCLDLVGSPNPGRITSNAISYAGGQLITISFALSGNQRILSSDVFNFGVNFTNPTSVTLFSLDSGFQGAYGGNGVGVTSLGTYSETIAKTRPFVNYQLTFRPLQAGSLRIFFAALGAADSRGPVLDNVLVTSSVVPEPAAWLMLISGFGLVGLASRRRRTSVAA